MPPNETKKGREADSSHSKRNKKMGKELQAATPEKSRWASDLPKARKSKRKKYGRN